MKGRIVINEERCKGCLLCTSVCQKGIIIQSNKLNSKGYKVVTVDEEKKEECIGCGFCAMICPDCVITVYRIKDNRGK